MAEDHNHREQSPSEETPLITHVSQPLDEVPNSVSFIRGSIIVLSTGMLLFIQTTNMSMMTTAQSDIAADLDAFSQTTWFNSAYLIAVSSVTPIAGRLSQIFRPRLYILFSCILLATGLFITAVASSLTIFLFGRALTGCGGGGLMVTAIILTLDLASNKRRGLFIGLINVGMTTGIASGAVLAGLLTPAYGWRIIFWTQAPLALILGPIQFYAIPDNLGDKSEQLSEHTLLQKLAKVDYLGAVALTTSVFLLLYSLASSEITIAPILLCPVAFAGFLLIEGKFASEPIIPVEVLRMRSVLLTCLAGLVSMMARWSVLFFSPVYALVVRNWSPASAGLILVPTNAGFGLGGVLVGWLHIQAFTNRISSCLVSFSVFGLSTLVLTTLSTPDSLALTYLFFTFLNGLSIGGLMNYSLSHVLHLTSADVHYIVTALLGMSRGFAGSFGSAIGGGFFQRELKRRLERGFAEHGLPGRDELIRKLLGSPTLVGNLAGAERAVAVQSYEQAVKVLFLGSFIINFAAVAAQAGTGWKPFDVKGKSREESRQEDLEERIERED
ncbi:putative MFS multidrug transporter [Aspergillus tanneri]|uniref:Major facilitator superfamily (MFS) profile domain-containing protein n=1 Tax=Aspergillus tanneri TaxID=1220188 RepID=A0A5M9MNN8_9EURO|nr:uncharacterized protein ATNIH1004_007986 [Aspergillus tanneri]KAA8646553.1 hypothetical protein ATNIH1004_007986 [Aspergillus tanneri]